MERWKKIEENKELMQTINETFVFDKFQRVLSNHMAMLDGRKGGVPFEETEYMVVVTEIGKDMYNPEDDSIGILSTSDVSLSGSFLLNIYLSTPPRVVHPPR